MSDLTKAPIEILVDLINTDNASALTSELVTFGLPTVAGGASPTRNTELTVNAAEGSGYTGSVLVTYNRVALSTLPVISSKPAEFQLGDATLISDLLEEINTLYGVKITAADFVDGPLPTFTGELNEEHDVQVVAHADSLIYIGSLTLKLKAEDKDLGLVITVTALNGLTYVAPAA